MTNDTCPIWGTPATITPTSRDGQNVNSPRAGGSYFITRSAEVNLKREDDTIRVRLTSWLVEQRRLGVHRPEITITSLDDVTKARAPSVHERADNLLRYLAAETDLLGEVISFYQVSNIARAGETRNELLAWTASRQISEVCTLAEYCREEGWIEYPEKKVENIGPTRGDTFRELMLRPPGYARLAVLDGVNLQSQQGFVAMWFDASMNDADKGIELGIEDAGYKPQRMDRKNHNNKIDDEIIAEIRRSRFLVADFTQGRTGARGGVYYEAGFAHGMHIPVIFTCRKDAIKKVHFDTRQYNHITWTTPDELREQLAQRISATIGDGPLKKP